jgi:indole-3-glycerol phosphate synthase
MTDVLHRIYAAKASALDQEQQRESYDELRIRGLAQMKERRSFLAAMEAASGGAIIGEFKRASPSAGLIARSFDPVAMARSFERAGCNAISVITERDHFLGELSHLEDVRRVTSCPIVRKDFIWTRYHVAQSSAHGADAMFLIVTGMSNEALTECMSEAEAYAIEVIVEVHDEAELRRAVAAGARIVAINNRNLRTLETDLAVSEHLLPKVPRDVVSISESGMRKASEVARLRSLGARGFLIGEALMQSEHRSELVASLRQGALSNRLLQ